MGSSQCLPCIMRACEKMRNFIKNTLGAKSGLTRKKQRPKRLISECGQNLYRNALWDVL